MPRQGQKWADVTVARVRELPGVKPAVRRLATAVVRRLEFDDIPPAEVRGFAGRAILLWRSGTTGREVEICVPGGHGFSVEWWSAQEKGSLWVACGETDAVNVVRHSVVWALGLVTFDETTILDLCEIKAGGAA